MTNFLNKFYHYYCFGSIGATMDNLVVAVREEKLTIKEAIRILTKGLKEDIHYGYNATQIQNTVNKFNEEVANG